MSTKGHQLATITKYKIAIANRKDRAELHRSLIEFIEKAKTNPQKFRPSILNAAIFSNISESALLHYEARSPENSEIRQLLAHIRDLSKQNLIENGLKGKFNSNLTTRLLEANHGLTAQPPQNLSQTNIYNVSPDILADAIKLSKKR